MEMPKVKVADFEGPFDLLLHLIKRNEMDIYNIEIFKITNQYLSYLNEFKEMNLEITSEFIVVAATLIEIKSKKLLPKVKNEEEESEEDIEKRLMERLIEYKKIKGVSAFFKDRYIKGGEVYGKKPEIIEEVKTVVNNDDIFKNITLIDLYSIYNKIIDNYREKQNNGKYIERKIYIDKYKIEDKIEFLSSKFQGKEIVNFQSMIEDCECKLETVVTFLALLELIKQRFVNVYQDESFGNIFVKRREEDEWYKSETIWVSWNIH